MQMLPRLVISATRGGLGKTTLALGVTSAWRKQGRRVAVFKKGPDFIDAGWLGAAAGRPCYNLDLFIMEQERILQSFRDHTAEADVAVIEGNRGLYDGVDEAGTYSTARLAKLLKTPVVLIVDCTKASSTVGAVVLGCRNFDPDVELKGIILNNVSPGRHETVVRKAIEQSSGVRVVGAVPRQKRGEFPERHMGLTPFHEHPEVEQAINAAAAAAEQYLDLDALWNIACDTSTSDALKPAIPATRHTEDAEHPIIGVIRDTAFQFYYPDNLEALEGQGARLTVINALKDRVLPDVDALYIGGGFPETQAAELAANGCTGPPTGLEGRFGFYRAWLHGKFDPAAITGGLGETWLVPDIFFKPYPANHFTHAAIDAAIELRSAGLAPASASTFSSPLPALAAHSSASTSSFFRLLIWASMTRDG